MIRQPVTSSNIASIGYDSDSQTLEIEFHTGAVYQYFGVPSSVHAELMQASSHGKYFSLHIRKQYKYTRAPK